MTALESVALKLLDDHVKHCVAGALASGDPDAAREKTQSCCRGAALREGAMRGRPTTSPSHGGCTRSRRTRGVR